MDYVKLGRTNIDASVVGLGAGGPSRIGKSAGRSPEDSIAVVRRAFELGVTFYDTAEGYGTEQLVGDALRDVPADQAYVSTKLTCKVDGRLKTEEEVERSVDNSLKNLRRDTIDVYHLHAVMPNDYVKTRDRMLPVLQRMRDKGKIRWIGITEMFEKDSGHHMLDQALQDDLWDVVMVGFSVLNFSARTLLQRAREQEVGVLDMFAVRRALRDLATITTRLTEYADEGLIDADAVKRYEPFSYAVSSGACSTIPELAYRFCRHEPGIDVVLSGTGSIDHLEANVKAAEMPAIPDKVIRRIEGVFAGVDDISGN